MADNLSNEAENWLLDTINGVAAFTPTLPLQLALFKTFVADTTAGTEVTGGSYARQNIAFGPAVNGVAYNTNALSFPNLPAGSISGLVIFDSSATPKRLWHGSPATTRSTVAGDSYYIAVGSISLSLA